MTIAFFQFGFYKKIVAVFILLQVHILSLKMLKVFNLSNE